MYQSNDFTWLAIWPMISLQVSHALSIITACIPTMKDIFEGLSHNVTAAIDAPYRLTTIHGKNGLQTTTALDSSSSSSRSRSRSRGTTERGGSRVAAAAADFSLHLVRLAPHGRHQTTTAHCCATRAARRLAGQEQDAAAVREDDGGGGGQSESVLNLRDGIVMTGEGEVDYDAAGGLGRLDSDQGSQASSHYKSQEL